MSTPGQSRETDSPARIVARLFAELTGFAVLLFVTRFVARGHLIPLSDQECHIGGIAVEVLTHGIRFPLMVYAPNEYDNGSFFSGLLAAGSFTLFGRNVLALKLVTHVISAAGAVATLWLLRRCLEELGWARERVRWAAIGALIVALAFAPRLVTVTSLYAVGNHAEGCAIDVILLALFSSCWRARSTAGIAAFWALVGFGLYINKGTALVIPVLAAVQIALAWRSPRRIAAAAMGFGLGMMPELLVLAQRDGMGWMTMASKAERSLHAFPRGFLESLSFLGENRIELLAAWALALIAGIAVLVRSLFRLRGPGETRGPLPVTLALVVAVTGLHLVALAIMAKGALESYAIYGYPTVVVLYALLVALVCKQAETRWGHRTGTLVGAALVALTLVLYRPDSLNPGFERVSALGRNRAGAACFWRFAEGFEREHAHGLASPDESREQHAIRRCRSLSGNDAILDCIGGIARELNWRQGQRVSGEPPLELTPAERRAYAYDYGTHRKGDLAACGDFVSPELAADCLAAAQLECLVFADSYTALVSGHNLGRPRCSIPEPPMEGFWAAMRRDFLSRTPGTGPDYTAIPSDFDLRSCKPVLDECF